MCERETMYEGPTMCLVPSIFICIVAEILKATLQSKFIFLVLQLRKLSRKEIKRILAHGFNDNRPNETAEQIYLGQILEPYFYSTEFYKLSFMSCQLVTTIILVLMK